MNATERPTLRWWMVDVGLVGIGLTASAYLLTRVFALLDPTRPAAHDLCSALFAASCDGALADGRFWVLNIPLAGWGVVYFAALGALLLLARFVEGTFEADALVAASLLAIGGVGAGFALGAAALLGRAPMCPLCVAIHALNLVLLLTLQRTLDRPVVEQLQRVRDCAGWLLRPRAAMGESARWSLVGLGCATLVAAVVYQWVFVETALRRPAPPPRPDRAQLIAAFAASPRVELPVSALDPHLGPLTAPVQLVVFESFRCRQCQRLASTLSRLQREFRDRLVVVFKHYPLSTGCNDRLAVDMQPGACEIALAAEAAHRQAGFWPFHDAMLAPGSRTPDQLIHDTVRRLRLDPVRFEADRRSDSARRRVAEDVALGNQLKVPGTPATFLDGRLVRPATAEALEILVRHELEQRAAAGAGTPRAHKVSDRPRRDGRPSRDG